MTGLRGGVAVVPVGLKRSLSRRVKKVADKGAALSFYEAYGVLGLPMLLIALVCVLWNTWFIILTLAPTWTANFLMNTASFDDSNFWLIVDTALWLKALSLMGLVLVALECVCVLFKMLLRRDLVLVRLPESFTRRAASWKEHGAQDRRLGATNDRADSFERQARMIADPSQIFLFRTTFDSLRILSATDFLLRVGMNLSFCNRFKRVVEVQIAIRRKPVAGIQQPRPTLAAHQRQVLRLWAMPFVLFGLLVIVATHKAITTSAIACAVYPQCVGYVYRWRSTSQSCPCLILIESDKEPRLWAEWANPVNASEIVRQLATSGDLRVLQLINRRLRILPEELRRCKDLRHISLLYTETESFPRWAQEFWKLEFLHIEGKSDLPSLQSLPEDLFANMHGLVFLHLGAHSELPSVPSFHGLSGLKRATFAHLFALTALPVFDSLSRLTRLELIYLPALVALPDMAPLTHRLRHFTAFRPMPICCNGFFRACDLTHPFCTPNAAISIPPVICLEDVSSLATPATQHILQMNAASVCHQVEDVIPQAPTEASVDECRGQRFRECRRLSTAGSANTVMASGICINSRMQVLACAFGPNDIEVRRRQIELGVGSACDTAIEAWFGCEKRALT